MVFRCPAELGRAGVSQADPLQQARQRWTLCCVGTTATPFRRGARGLPITAQIILKPAALARCASAAKNSDNSVSAQDVISRVLRLRCGTNHKPAVIATVLQL